MLSEMRDLMQTLAGGIASDAGAADFLLSFAVQLEDMGEVADAAALRTLARMHRVKVIEYQARLEGMAREYVRRFNADAADDGRE